MRVTISSKNIPLTSGLKTFVTTKLSTLKKFSSARLSTVSVLLDVDRRKKGAQEDAVVEIIGVVDKNGPIAVREHADTFYKAFYGAMAKIKKRLRRNKRKTLAKNLAF